MNILPHTFYQTYLVQFIKQRQKCFNTELPLGTTLLTTIYVAVKLIQPQDNISVAHLPLS